MTYQVRWTRPASIALEQIQDFIAQENPEAATLVIKDIFHTVERLKDHPKSGRKGRVRGTYELILSGFCLLYTSPSPRDRTRSRMPSSA